MQFTFAHNNLNVRNLKESIAFYEQALGLRETKRIEATDGSFLIVFLGDGRSVHKLELTWLRDRKEKYNLGDNELPLAFETDDMDTALQRHREMGCVCFENPEMGIYFITDPDGYWIEIIPVES